MPVALHALIDFFNVARLRNASKPSYADYRDALDNVVSRIIDVSSTLMPPPCELAGRIYGGWFQADPHRPTIAKDILDAVVRRYFPTRRPLRVRMTLADSLVSFPHEVLTATLRVMPGMPHIRVNELPIACASPIHCPISGLRKWLRGQCPNSSCSVRTYAVCSRVTQKLVDTAICCDMIALAQLHQKDWILVASDDDDLVPGLLMASAFNSRMVRLRRGEQATVHYNVLLESKNILTLDA